MKKNYYSATATAAKITKVPVEVIRAGFRKGAKPEGRTLNAVIVARQIYNTDVNLFDPDSAGKFRGIHLSVQRFLWSQSRKQRSPFERKKWGTYALKKKFVFQLELEFEDWEDEDIVIERPEKKRAATDKELMQDIFAGMLF